MLSGLPRTNNCRFNMRFSSTAANDSPTSQSVGEHKRNEVWYKKTLTKADKKVIPTGISKENSHVKAFGQSKEKIEVDGMMLNWDVAGTGEHVVLLLPGALGIINNYLNLYSLFFRVNYVLCKFIFNAFVNLINRFNSN